MPDDQRHAGESIFYEIERLSKRNQRLGLAVTVLSFAIAALVLLALFRSAM
jgi:hypothetical protein